MRSRVPTICLFGIVGRRATYAGVPAAVVLWLELGNCVEKTAAALLLESVEFGAGLNKRDVDYASKFCRGAYKLPNVQRIVPKNSISSWLYMHVDHESKNVT